jgi:hypothetical protein
MRMKTGTAILVISIIFILISCKRPKNKEAISVTYSVEALNSKLSKVTFLLKNNDPVDYFIPFIKPACNYSKFSDKKLSRGIQWNYVPTDSIVTPEDLRETGQLDSSTYDEGKDTTFFYFRESYVKNYYDSILKNFKDKTELRFIYPYYYYAIGNQCIYLKKGETKEIISYLHHYYALNPKELLVSFNFNTDSISMYKEKYFEEIPEKIKSYVLFRGQIKLNP